MGANGERHRPLGGSRAPYTRTDVERSAVGFASSTRLPGSGRSASGGFSSPSEYVAALGALTGAQAVQMVKAGLRCHLPLRLAGRRRRESLGHTYPDQSLYPANSAPALVAG